MPNGYKNLIPETWTDHVNYRHSKLQISSGERLLGICILCVGKLGPQPDPTDSVLGLGHEP